MSKIFSVLIVSTMCFYSCHSDSKSAATRRSISGMDEPPPPTPIEMIGSEWLGGTWKAASDGREMYEVWKKVNDTVYAGTSYTVEGKDTIVQETIELRHEGHEIYYIPTVNGQNNNKPILFKLTDLDYHTATFENPGHDFPQVIRYKLISPDSLVASISGKMKGKDDTEYFPMKKVK